MNDIGRSDRLDRHLHTLVIDPSRQAEMVAVIVRLRLRTEGATPADKAADFTRRIRPVADRLEALGAEIIEPLWIANAIAARLPVSALARAAADDDIAQLISDHARKAL